jgi:hypothetical protein
MDKHGDAAEMDLVFHGGSGTSSEDLQETLDYGVVKMNIDTDTQYAFTRPIVTHMCANIESVLKIDGEVAHTQRAEYVKRFQNDPTCRVALLSITSCSEGITLTAANIVVFCEMYWVPGLIEQAEARAHRVGQKDCVLCYYLVMPNSPDEVIFNMLERKKKDTSKILDGTETGLISANPPPAKPVPVNVDDDLASIIDLLDDESQWVPANTVDEDAVRIKRMRL